MAITLITSDYDNNIDLESEVFVGRVLRVERTSETRNWSDTLDYSDYRTTQCTYALVWLGTHGFPPGYINTPRPMAHWGSLRGAHEQLPDYLTDKVRDLEYFEQFAWVDCTNLHGDRMASKLVNPIVDATIDSGEPLMLANQIAWEGYQKSLTAKRLRELEAAAELARKVQAENEATAAARNAKRDAKAAASKVVADAELEAVLTLKGTSVTVDGFTGTVFWMGVRQYRGTWNANAGIKDVRGEVKWVPCRTLAV